MILIRVIGVLREGSAPFTQGVRIINQPID